MWNGLQKFEHPLYSFHSDFYSYCFYILDSFFPLLETHSSLMSLEEAVKIASDPEHAVKAAGFPSCSLGCTTKGAALQQLGVEQLMKYYYGTTAVKSATLKDEIRPVGKDSRLFRLQDVSAYLEALMLFNAQNEYMMSLLHNSPMFVKFQTPGPDILRMYGSLTAHNGKTYSADGMRWDALFPLAIAAIIVTWRTRTFDKDRTRRAQRYYCMMYNGFTEVSGLIFNLIGQSSGQLNTTIDNTLGHVIMMSYNAWATNVPVDQFLRDVLFYACGDDLIYSTRIAQFEPDQLARTYANMGMFLEFESLESGLGTFVGAVPAERVIDGVRYSAYCNRVGRALASAEFDKRGKRPIDKLAKLVSLAMKTFFDEPVYTVLRNRAFAYADECLKTMILLPSNSEVRGLLAVLNEERLISLYFSYESLSTLPSVLFSLLNKTRLDRWSLK